MTAATTSQHDSALQRVWTQSEIPVIWIPPTAPANRRAGLLVRLDHTLANQFRLRNGRHRIPAWSEVEGAWIVPNAWLEELIQELTERFDAAYVLQMVRDEQTCNHACWSAHRARCECSCLGANHAINQRYDLPYKLVSTEAMAYGELSCACRKYVARWSAREEGTPDTAESVRSVSCWPEVFDKRGVSRPSTSSLGPAPGVGGTRSRA